MEKEKTTNSKIHWLTPFRDTRSHCSVGLPAHLGGPAAQRYTGLPNVYLGLIASPQIVGGFGVYSDDLARGKMFGNLNN